MLWEKRLSVVGIHPRGVDKQLRSMVDNNLVGFSEAITRQSAKSQQDRYHACNEIYGSPINNCELYMLTVPVRLDGAEEMRKGEI